MNSGVVKDNLDQKKSWIFNAIKSARNTAVREAIDYLYEEIRKNISMSHHSKAELKALGSPFAKKHGEILPHGHLPLWSVHVEYGIILKELNKKMESDMDKTTGMVGWFNPHDEIVYVINKMGTTKMTSRPVHKLTAEEIKIGDFLLEKFKKNMGK